MYDTQLSPQEESKFKIWKLQYAPQDSGEDYDLRGAFKAGLTPDLASGHWPDTYKKPNHPTFSNESIYATGADAAKAGSWNGNTFLPPRQMPKIPDKKAALEYLKKMILQSPFSQTINKFIQPVLHPKMSNMSIMERMKADADYTNAISKDLSNQ